MWRGRRGSRRVAQRRSPPDRIPPLKLVEGGHRVRRRRGPLGRILGQKRVNQIDHGRRQVGANRTQRRRMIPGRRLDRRECVAPLEDLVPRRRFVKHDPQAEEIGPRTGRLVNRLRLFRRHVCRRALQHIVGRPLVAGLGVEHQPEIEDQCLPTVRVRLQPDVRRLDVPVNEPGPVGRAQPARNPSREANQFTGPERAFREPCGQSLPAKQWHDLIQGRTVFIHIVQGENVLVIQPGDGPRFLEKLGPIVRTIRIRRANHLHGHRPVRIRVKALEHDAHAALGQLADDAIFSQAPEIAHHRGWPQEGIRFIGRSFGSAHGRVGGEDFDHIVGVFGEHGGVRRWRRQRTGRKPDRSIRQNQFEQVRRTGEFRVGSRVLRHRQ